MAIDPKTAAAVLALIDEEELVDLVLRLANIESPPGGEGPVGDAIHGWLEEQGFSPKRVGMFEDRFNVFAELPGSGTGPALAFNAHMDTSVGRDFHLIMRDPNRPDFHGGWAEGDLLVGNPVVNDKGPMAAFMIATKALRDAKVDLCGERLPEHRRRRDRPGAGRRVPGQAVPEQGSRSEVSPQPLAAPELLPVRRGDELPQGVGRGREGVLQAHRLRRAGALHAVPEPPVLTG